jgi:hypothetical protein
MLAIFAIAAALMYARVIPALLAVPLLALGVAAVAGAGPAGLGVTITDGIVRLAPVIVTVIFGALLSRVTLATGIAETIVSYAAEFGGDQPALLALALCAAVAVLFTSLTGLGAIIMVGSIVLPIMLTIGVPRKTAATLFLLAFALGFVFNIAQWTFYAKTFGIERAQLQPFAFALAGIQVLAIAAFAVVRFRAARGYATWALEAEEPLARRRAPFYALVTPLVPIVLYLVLHVDAVVAFALAALYGVLSATPRRAIGTLVAAAIRGVEDVAPAVLLFMGIGMLLVATGLPSVRAALEPLVAAIAPRSPLAYVILFGLLSPLALYRGPLNPFGVGIAVYTVLASLAVLPPVALVAAIMAVVQVQNVCDPTNTQNVWVANFTGVGVAEITKLTLPFQTAVATLGTIAVVLFARPLIGAQPFALAVPAAAATASASSAAATVAPSSASSAAFARPDAANVIGVAAVDAGPAAAAAHAIYRAISGGWPGYRADELSVPPGDGACTERPYAALLVVSASPLDVNVDLDDCANWPVDQFDVAWSAPAAADATGTYEKAGLDALFRVRTWMTEHPARAHALFASGLGCPVEAVPTYFYSLFKTVDGQMRAYVRPGGPAYAAGLRTNDIIEKLDGKYWWEYGTYQTQQRAYDATPHTFELMRGPTTLTVTLGSPFDGCR